MAQIHIYRFVWTPGGFSQLPAVLGKPSCFRVSLGTAILGSRPGMIPFQNDLLQRLANRLPDDCARLFVQWHGHLDPYILRGAFESIIDQSNLEVPKRPGINGLQPPLADFPMGAKVDFISTVIPKALAKKESEWNGVECLMLVFVGDAERSADCVNCGQKKDPTQQILSHSVVPASFWEPIVKGALWHVGVDWTRILNASDNLDYMLFSKLIAAGEAAAGTFENPGAEPDAASMCKACEEKHANFSLLQRFLMAQRWSKIPRNSGRAADLRIFIGKQFLPPDPASLGDWESLFRRTTAAVKRVAETMGRKILDEFDARAKKLKPLNLVPSPTIPPRNPLPPQVLNLKAQKTGGDPKTVFQNVVHSLNRVPSGADALPHPQAEDFHNKSLQAEKARMALLKLDTAANQLAFKTDYQRAANQYGFNPKAPIGKWIEDASRQIPKSTLAVWAPIPKQYTLAFWLGEHLDKFLDQVMLLALLASTADRTEMPSDIKTRQLSGV